MSVFEECEALTRIAEAGTGWANRRHADGRLVRPWIKQLGGHWLNFGHRNRPWIAHD